MTSANVTEYTIRDLTGKTVGKHSQHAYCKPTWGELLKFIPAEAHTITPWSFDEEEEFWEGEAVNLQIFIDDLKKNRAEFNTWEDIKKAAKKKIDIIAPSANL